MKRPSLESRLVMLQLVLSASVIMIFAGSALWLSSRTLDREEEPELAATAAQVAESISREWAEHSDLKRAAITALNEESPVGVRIEVQDEQRRPIHATPAGWGPGPRSETRRPGDCRGRPLALRVRDLHDLAYHQGVATSAAKSPAQDERCGFHAVARKQMGLELRVLLGRQA